ncbi:MAG: TSUP family transporter [Beijerinckiaceae bacterium]
MEYFYTAPDIGPWLFAGLCAASFATAFIGVVTGAAGGLILLATMANTMRPEVLIAVHTVVQLGQGFTRTFVMWRYVMRETVLPFVAGAAVGAAIGAKIFISLPLFALQLILGVFILFVTWVPRLGRIGAIGGRFAVVGFMATFVGVFVSATGTLIAPFIAAAAPDRRNHAATLGALMTFTHTLKLIAFAFAGIAIGAYAPLMAGMVVTGFFGNWLGFKALDRMPEARFRLIFQLLLTVLGLRLIWMAFARA